MPPKPDDALNWLAFLYVSGELAAAEEMAFEGRLERDQAAREAVADAVGMVEAVAALPSNLVSSSPSRSHLVLPARRYLCWIAAAACLIAASLPAFRDFRPADPVAPSPLSPSADVALAWSGSLNDRVGEPSDPELLSWIGEFETSEVMAASEGPASPPSWLLLAASSPAADPDGTEHHEE